MYGHIVLHIDTQNISTDLTHILILISHILTADSGPARPTCVRMTAPRARLYGSCDFSLHPKCGFESIATTTYRPDIHSVCSTAQRRIAILFFIA